MGVSRCALAVALVVLVAACNDQPQSPQTLDRVDYHTNPPIVLGKGNSPHVWLRDGKDMPADYSIFGPGGTCAAGSAKIGREFIGWGSEYLFFVGRNNEPKHAQETTVTLEAVYDGGRRYKLQMWFDKASDRNNSRRNVFTLEYTPAGGTGTTCNLESAHDNDPRWDGRIPTEFAMFDPDVAAVTIEYELRTSGETGPVVLPLVFKAREHP